MSGPPPTPALHERFAAALGDAARAALAARSPDEVEAVLGAHLDEGRRAWPGIEVAEPSFLARLARGLDAATSLDTLRALRGSDLYLACACANGDQAAIAAFERAYFREVDVAAARLRAGPTIAEEVKQTLRRALFVAEPDRAAAIDDYAGRGDLRGWVRVSAIRAAQRLLQRARREVELDDGALLAVLSPAEDPELGYLRDRYRDEFAAAFHDALDATSVEDRSLIRYQLVDGLTIDDIARLHRVHRATAARRLAAARDRILERTRSALSGRLGLPLAEIDSLIRLLHSRLEVSIERLLR